LIAAGVEIFINQHNSQVINFLCFNVTDRLKKPFVKKENRGISDFQFPSMSRF